jgi:spore germination protein YaaH
VRRSFWFFAIVWSALMLLGVVAADPPNPQTTSTRQPIIGAWLRSGTRDPLRQLIVIVATRFKSYNEISAFSYTVERDGALTANDPVNDGVLIDFARANNIRVIPTVSSTWDSTHIVNILKSPTLRARHIEAIMQVARSPLIDGIDIDYENLPPSSRQAFTDFITLLAFHLHNEGKTLSVTVMPKVRDNDGSTLAAVYDYTALGQVADQIRVMAYEYHGKSGPPAPNAPIWWVRQVMSYTVSAVPNEKAILGIHLYGYDWGGAETTAMWWNDVQALKEKYGGVDRYVETDERGIVGEIEMTYTINRSPLCPLAFFDCAPFLSEKHTIYYVDARYVAEAWKILKELRLGGVVMWRPGGEDPAIWDVFK